MWVLTLEDVTWRFSTKELARDAIEFFELDENDYDLEFCNSTDDEEIIERFQNQNFKPEKYGHREN